MNAVRHEKGGCRHQRTGDSPGWVKHGARAGAITQALIPAVVCLDCALRVGKVCIL